MLQLIEQWTFAHSSETHVVMGPVFDFEADGLRDTQVNV